MYSRNDYRYYLENQLMHSDDYLAHYGVKGMKWKRHKLGLNELNKVMLRDQEAFYARNSQDAERALRQKKVAQKAYDKTVLGKLDKKTGDRATSLYRALGNKSREKAEAKSREKRKAAEERSARANKSIQLDKERGKNRTVKERSRKRIQADQNQGKKRTAQYSGKSSEYLSELEYNSKKNRW